uniref:(California timema) hypothetical protein n=1 Tax=Timema californicum TaxID=61474 RepID=A0A7R9P5U0_TIMCA|nr:unnamed protein product [Timema californicum]
MGSSQKPSAQIKPRSESTEGRKPVFAIPQAPWRSGASTSQSQVTPRATNRVIPKKISTPRLPDNKSVMTPRPPVVDKNKNPLGITTNVSKKGQVKPELNNLTAPPMHHNELRTNGVSRSISTQNKPYTVISKHKPLVSTSKTTLKSNARQPLVDHVNSSRNMLNTVKPEKKPMTGTSGFIKKQRMDKTSNNNLSKAGVARPQAHEGINQTAPLRRSLTSIFRNKTSRRPVLKRSQSQPEELNTTYECENNHSPIQEGLEISVKNPRHGDLTSTKRVRFYSPMVKKTLTPQMNVYTPKPSELRLSSSSSIVYPVDRVYNFSIEVLWCAWLTNAKCFQKALQIWNPVVKFLKEAKLPKTKPVETLKRAACDPFLKCKLAFCKTIADECQPFLHWFQTSKPMTPYILEAIEKLLRYLMNRCVKPDLRNLLDWLEKRGKPVANFHHLHCFGLHASEVEKEANKRINLKKHINLSSQAVSVSPITSTTTIQDKQHDIMTPQKLGAVAEESQEPICSSTPNQSPSVTSNQVQDSLEDKENVFREDLDVLAQDSLNDLYKLIQTGYPRDKCEEWLDVILKNCRSAFDKPIYWECRASLEEYRGDFSTAIECYSRAIVKGAQPEEIGQSLDQLLQTFGRPKMDAALQELGDKKVSRKSLDACNVFKSTIIKFALQQRAIKQVIEGESKVSRSQLVVTPVRRSTRKSSFQYQHTPDMRYVDTLTTLEDRERNTMVFQPNKMLLPTN